MQPGEDIFIMSVLLIIVGILTALTLLQIKLSFRQRFLFRSRLKRIQWMKALKYWAIIQFVLLIGKTDAMSWLTTIVLPLIIVYVIVINTFGQLISGDEHIIYTSKQFKEEEKIDKRDKKIRSILK